MSDYWPLGISLAFLLFIGLVFPFVLHFFVSPQNIDPSPLASTLIDLLENGISIPIFLFDITLNPFEWLGSNFQDTLIESVTYLGILPNFLVSFIVIMMIVAIFYSIIKLVTIIFL